MRQKGQLCSLQSDEKGHPFVATKTVENKYKDTFTSTNSLRRTPLAGIGTVLMFLSRLDMRS
jgi:hypothetical protein